MVATLRPRWGYRRLDFLLRRQRHEVNRKLAYRLCHDERLGGKRRMHKRGAVPRTPMVAPSELNERNEASTS